MISYSFSDNHLEAKEDKTLSIEIDHPRNFPIKEKDQDWELSTTRLNETQMEIE